MIKPFMNGEKVHWNDTDLELTWVRPELPPIEKFMTSTPSRTASLIAATLSDLTRLDATPSRDAASSHLHLRHRGGAVQAVKTWNTPGEQLLRPKSRDDDELKWIDVDWTDDHGGSSGLCLWAMPW